MSATVNGDQWLPSTFSRPDGVAVGASHHLRHIRGEDAEIDHAAVTGSRERLWRRYGQRFGWPRATMTLEEDRIDLERHLHEADRNESFNYALLDHEETAVLGCVYIDPPTADGRDAEISWWVVDELVGSPLEARLNQVVPRWITTAWPFRRPLLDPAVG